MDENRFYLSHFGTATVLNWCSNFICEWNAISLYQCISVSALLAWIRFNASQLKIIVIERKLFEFFVVQPVNFDTAIK